MSTMKLDLSDLSLGDVEDFEELTGTSIGSISEGLGTVKQMRALIFICDRKKYPDMKFEDTRNIKFKDLENLEVVGFGDEDVNPTEEE